MPNAVRDAIPDYMAMRGPDGIQGGPIRLHHDFWQPFLQRAIGALGLSEKRQFELVAAIALPIGRVTSMSVDNEGRTHWEGYLSEANPIAKIVWQMLKEGLIHLGVSLGGRILQVADGGRDALGKPCRLITRIRIDELSVTDNPALRITDGSDHGAYIMALAKSVLGPPPRMASPNDDVQRFLSKALGGDGGASLFNSGETTVTGMGSMSRSLTPKQSVPRSGKKIQLDSSSTTTGMGKDNVAPAPKGKPAGKGNGWSTDVWGMTVEQFTRGLAKCGDMQDPHEWAEAANYMRDGSMGLIGLTNRPPDDLLNLVRLLSNVSRYAMELPYMTKSCAAATMREMGDDLKKMADQFMGSIPGELKGKPLKPPGAKSFAALDIAVPEQYTTQM